MPQTDNALSIGGSASFSVTAPTMDDSVMIKDFTRKKRRIAFKVDDEVFDARPTLGPALMQDLIGVAKNLSDFTEKQDLSPLYEVFNKLLNDESGPRFLRRLQSTGDDALDVRDQIIPIMYYLLESYGLRPTQQSSDSSTGSSSETGGTSSTPGS